MTSSAPDVSSTGHDRLAVDLTARRDGFVLTVDVVVGAGEVLGVVGPNGAGKSTLLQVVAGLRPVSTGTVRLGASVLDDGGAGTFVPAAQRAVGYVFQDYRLFPHLSVLDNVAFAPRSRGLQRHEARAVASDWMDRLAVSDLAERKPGSLSGGQAQRVALARALAGAPSLLLLDEPLAALDARSRIDIQTELREHLRSFSGPCLLVTHDPLEALLFADRLLVIEEGEVVQHGAPADVASRPATDYIARLVGLNLYPARAESDIVVLDCGGALVVPDHGHTGPVLVAVRPSAIVISTEQPRGVSTRNSWAGTVAGMAPLTDRVRLEVIGHPSALVDVTPAAIADLSLAPGRPVWLSVKATDVEVYPRPQGPRADRGSRG